ADGLHAVGLAVDRCRRHAEAGQVTMAVDEARQERAPTQVHDARAGPGQRPDLGVAAGGQDAAAAHGEGGHDVVGGVDGVDAASGEDQVGAISHGAIAYRACPTTTGSRAIAARSSAGKWTPTITSRWPSTSPASATPPSPRCTPWDSVRRPPWTATSATRTSCA